MTYTLELTPEQVESLKQQGIIESGEWKPDYGGKYFWVSGDNQIYETTWNDARDDKGAYLIGNVFKTEAEANLHKLRLQSMAQRGKMPEVGDEVGYWDFRANSPIQIRFNLTYIPDWAIGSVKATKEECEEWGAKFAKAGKYDLTNPSYSAVCVAGNNVYLRFYCRVESG